MALSVDTRKVVKAELVPWGPGQWGVAWETGDGKHGADHIGIRSDAEKIVRDVDQQRVAAAGAALVRPRNG